MEEIDPVLLREAVRRLVATLQPEKIYLYGSHAYGQPHKDSDIDLLIVVAESAQPTRKKAVEAYRALRGLLLPAEIKVVTRAEFERRGKWLSSIERVAVEKGRMLYELQADSRVLGQKG